MGENSRPKGRRFFFCRMDGSWRSHEPSMRQKKEMARKRACARASKKEVFKCLRKAKEISWAQQSQPSSLKRFIMKDDGVTLEQTINMAAPLWEKWPSAKIIYMRLKRRPDVDKHILSRLLNTTFYSCRNDGWMLANNSKTSHNGLS